MVFDKTGALAGLLTAAGRVHPTIPDRRHHPFDRFMLQHADDKVRRSLATDPISSLYSMHACIGDVLGVVHYQAHGRYKVSSKKLLGDLETWDPALADLVRRFVGTADAAQKAAEWALIVDHVAATFGGRRSLVDVRCDCQVCRSDLAVLERAAEKDNGAHRLPDAPRSGDIAWTR